jgi:GNAT superfamily N-acetyltransferase
MPSANEVKVRNYLPQDRNAVRDIFFETAFLGESAAAFFSDKEIVCDALTLYFTDYEPESCFVAAAGPDIVGCLIGAKKKALAEEIFSARILPRLLLKTLLRGVFLKPRNLAFLSNVLLSLAKGEFRMPVSLKEFPATLHINISKAYRNMDIGSRLIASYTEYLRNKGVHGVCLATMSESASRFFSSAGFRLVYSGKRSYFRYLLNKDLPIHIYAKTI